MTVDIAVVVPTIGRPELSRALASVLGQSRRPSELIVVDNGPVDGVRVRQAEIEAIDGGDVDIRWISLPPRSGPGICRNVGAWVARAPHVAFLDDDDAFGPGYLEVLGSYMEGDRVDVVFARKVKCDQNGAFLTQKRLSDHPHDSWLQRMYAQKNHGFGGQNLMVVRTNFFSVGGFPTDLRTGQDRGFAIAAMRAGLKVDYVDSVYVQCFTPTGYRARRDSSRWQTYLKILVDNWSDMTWPTRVTSVRKTATALAVYLYKSARGRWQPDQH